MNERPPPTYSFGPRNRRGVIGSVRTGQLGALCVVLVVIVGLLRAGRGSPGAVGASVALLLSCSALFVPLRGRTIDEWAPVISRHLVRHATSANSSATRIGAAIASRRAPNVFAPFLVSEHKMASGHSVGVLTDRRAGTSTAVLSVFGESFSLLSRDEQVRRCQAWSSVLASFANSSARLHRLQWIARNVPDGARSVNERARALAADRSPVPELRTAKDVYVDFVSYETTSALRHEVLLALTVRGKKTAPAARPAPHERAGEGPGPLLIDELLALDRRCRGAGLKVEGVLSAAGLRRFVARAFSSGTLEADVAWPWPNAVESTWSQLRTDGLFHATYWIAEWPRSEVRCDFLVPLLEGAHERQALALVLAPVEPARAMRRAEHERTSSASDHELRRRHGFQLSARTLREHESVLRREVELAEGHGLYRLTGYLSVSAADAAELEAAAVRVEQRAALARLELHRLYGDQAEAFCSVLPTGRGCQ